MNATEVSIELRTAGVSRACRVVIGAGHLARHLASCACSFLVADEHVLGLHEKSLGSASSLAGTRLPRGERAKSFSHLESLLEALAEHGADRTTTLLAFGGGVTCDLAGLAAALYMRGISWVAAPTTLLAQVDASVGGKTAINIGAGKNLVGAFHQPGLVIADTSLLATLAEEELLSGLGEVIKAAVLGAEVQGGQSLFAWLEDVDAAAIANRDAEVLATIVASCVRFKARIVEADEREAGPRKQLNLGHTFAHAIERVAGYGRIPHGIAVAAGIGAAMDVARREGLLSEDALPERTRALAKKLGLPRSCKELREQTGLALPEDELIAAMGSDKKNAGGKLGLVLPRALGEVALDKDVAPFL